MKLKKTNLLLNILGITLGAVGCAIVIFEGNFLLLAGIGLMIWGNNITFMTQIDERVRQMAKRKEFESFMDSIRNNCKGDEPWDNK